MLIILPPSETKDWGGNGPTLDCSSLSFPELNPVRLELIEDLIRTCRNPSAAYAALKISPRLHREVDANRDLYASSTQRAVNLYTGVLYDSLEASSLTLDELKHLFIASALFGLVRSTDFIPHYRLSATSKFALTKRWKNRLTDSLNDYEDAGLILDLRSLPYIKLDPLEDYKRGPVCTLKVVNSHSGKVVSHYSKHHKGVLARDLLSVASQCDTVDDLIGAADEAGHRLEILREHPGTPILELKLHIDVR